MRDLRAGLAPDRFSLSYVDGIVDRLEFREISHGDKCGNRLTVAGEVRDMPRFSLSECIADGTDWLTCGQLMTMGEAHGRSLPGAADETSASWGC